MKYLWIVFFMMLTPVSGFAEENAEPALEVPAPKPPERRAYDFVVVEAEILEAQEVEDKEGHAIFVVKDLTTGNKKSFHVDPIQSTIEVEGEIQPYSGQFLGGKKGVIIYDRAAQMDPPLLIFFHVRAG